jgi:5-methylcytosine-specific restriction endonuclease McrA
MDQLAHLNEDLRRKRLSRRKARDATETNAQNKRVAGMRRVADVKKRASSHIASVKRKYPHLVKDEGPWVTAVLAAWIESTNDQLCKYCGDAVYHVDHTVPLVLGGDHSWDNLARLCKTCNLAKGSLLPEEFEEWISRLIRYQDQEVV